MNHRLAVATPLTADQLNELERRLQLVAEAKAEYERVMFSAFPPDEVNRRRVSGKLDYARTLYDAYDTEEVMLALLTAFRVSQQVATAARQFVSAQERGNTTTTDMQRLHDTYEALKAACLAEAAV